VNPLLEAFLLGNSAILTNVCILPLYPGLVAYLAGAGEGPGRPARRWLGLPVLAGVLTLMVLLGGLLHLARRPFAAILPLLLPAIYGAVILLGLLMLLGRNPFARLALARAPVLRNPVAGAYVYGLLLGPMTLPCAGPIILSAFLLGAGSPARLAGELAYFLAFGLGFGWPLVLLPVAAAPLQRRFTSSLAAHHPLLTRAAGLLLLAIGAFGLLVDWLPNL
jgi:cytochrome c-type biogenesis protein